MSLALHLTNVARDNLLEVYAVDDHVNVLLVYHYFSVLLAVANIVIVRQDIKYTVSTVHITLESFIYLCQNLLLALVFDDFSDVEL